jgi:hypothetical protein
LSLIYFLNFINAFFFFFFLKDDIDDIHESVGLKASVGEDLELETITPDATKEIEVNIYLLFIYLLLFIYHYLLIIIIININFISPL